MSRILLDTNAYTRLCRGDKRVLDALATADTVYLSTIVMGELHAGFRGGTKEAENRQRLGRFINKPAVTVLDVDPETAEVFGEVKEKLRRAGTPLPINDVWIGAHALQHGAVLVTFDGHFADIAGIRLWDSGLERVAG